MIDPPLNSGAVLPRALEAKHLELSRQLYELQALRHKCKGTRQDSGLKKQAQKLREEIELWNWRWAYPRLRHSPRRRPRPIRRGANIS
jgi:hypothetical protein